MSTEIHTHIPIHASKDYNGCRTWVDIWLPSVGTCHELVHNLVHEAWYERVWKLVHSKQDAFTSK